MECRKSFLFGMMVDAQYDATLRLPDILPIYKYRGGEEEEEEYFLNIINGNEYF